MSISSSDSAAPAHSGRQPADIKKLPNEVLEQIFLISNEPRHFGEPDSISLWTSVRISWVCSRWRAIALSRRQIWARCVSLEIGGPRMQDEFIRRSDPWPLDLYAGAYLCTERLRTFTSPNVAQRVRSFMIYSDRYLDSVFAFLNQSLPRLETIHVHGRANGRFSISRSTLAKARNVKEISCRYGVDFDFISFLDEPTVIHRLTSFEFLSGPRYTIHANDLLLFLAEAHNLEHLSLDMDIMPEHIGDEWKWGEIKLTKATKVSLVLSSRAAVEILPIVSFSDSLYMFLLKISLDDMGHYPAVISSVEERVRLWDRKWNHSVKIKLRSDAAFSIEALDTPISNNTSTGCLQFSFGVQYPSLRGAGRGRLAPKVTTHLVYPAIQALTPTILSTAWRVSIQKPVDVPATLDAVASPIANLDMDDSWNLVDGLLDNETLYDMTELELLQDGIPFIRHILNRVVDSMHAYEVPRRGALEYPPLPKLRAIVFGVSLKDVEGLSLCRDLVRADFFIEPTLAWGVKVTLPGRYEGECPVQKALEKILKSY